MIFCLFLLRGSNWKFPQTILTTFSPPEVFIHPSKVSKRAFTRGFSWGFGRNLPSEWEWGNPFWTFWNFQKWWHLWIWEKSAIWMEMANPLWTFWVQIPCETLGYSLFWTPIHPAEFPANLDKVVQILFVCSFLLWVHIQLADNEFLDTRIQIELF